MVVELSGEVEAVQPGRLRGQRIVTVSAGGYRVRFDSIEGLFSPSEGDRLDIVFSEAKPENIDDYHFCGHGYLVSPEAEAGKTIFSVWGIIFIVEPPIGLRDGVKYYLCIRRR